MNYNAALYSTLLDISHTEHIICLELMGRSGLSKSSRKTPTAKLETTNQKNGDIHIISRSDNTTLFKLRKGHKASIRSCINISTTFWKDEISET
jgi:hypothetical protein